LLQFEKWLAEDAFSNEEIGKEAVSSWCCQIEILAEALWSRLLHFGEEHEEQHAYTKTGGERYLWRTQLSISSDEVDQGA